MRLSTLLRLALAGSRTDILRVSLTAMSAALAALAVLAAVTVLAIPGGVGVGGTVGLADQYRSNLLAESGLRLGVALGLVLLTLPVLGLAAQCGRLGAPARDRRLAVIRLAGATPRQAVSLVAVETGVASTLGTVIGLAAYFIGRKALHRPDAAGQLALPTDVLPAPWALGAIAIGLPLLATAVAAVLLRGVAANPFGVVRKVRLTAPRPWPGLLIVPGLAACAVIGPLGRYAEGQKVELPSWVTPLLFFVGGLLALVGIVLGTGWISYTAGRVLHRLARRPAALLAARRLMADPWSGSRTFAALLACVMFGAGAAEVRALLGAQFAAEEKLGLRQDTSFYFQSLDLVDAAVMVATAIAAAGLLVALAEGIVSRRRAFAALVATGVPRATLAKSILWQVLAPVVPAVMVALAVGAALIQGVVPDESTTPGTFPIPFADLALLGAGALAVVLAVVGLGLLFLRSSTEIEELRTG